MSRRLQSSAGLIALALLAALSGGCVDRRFIIESEPPGAVVYVNNQYIGATPVDLPFQYYGTYRFTFVADGYETLTVDECVRPPWYEYFPLEFLSECLWPGVVRDLRSIHKPMQPMQMPSPEEIRARAEQLRAQGQSIGVPLPPPGAPPP